MKKFSHFIITVFSVLAILLQGCNKTPEDDSCIGFLDAPVIKVAGPKTAAVNQPVSLAVYFTCYNGCGQFGNYEPSINGNTSTIKVKAKYQGCICTQVILTQQNTYVFKSAQPGIFYLKFLQSPNTYLTDTITVQ